MPKYRVKQGQKFGPSGEYLAGAILELTEAEASGFKDKLERVDDNALAGSIQEVVSHEDFQFKNEMDVEVPDDLKLMPSTLSAAEDLTDADEAEEDDLGLLNEEQEEPKSRRKPTGKSTRKRAAEE